MYRLLCDVCGKLILETRSEGEMWDSGILIQLVADDKMHTYRLCSVECVRRWAEERQEHEIGQGEEDGE